MESLEKQKPKSSPDAEPKLSSNVNLAQKWGFSPELMQELSAIPPERRAHESGTAGHSAVLMAEGLPVEKSASETLVDELAFLGGALLLPELAPELRVLAMGDVVVEGSPYDKANASKGKKTAA
jgi:hypothetical protein